VTLALVLGCFSCGEVLSFTLDAMVLGLGGGGDASSVLGCLACVVVLLLMCIACNVEVMLAWVLGCFACGEVLCLILVVRVCSLRYPGDACFSAGLVGML